MTGTRNLELKFSLKTLSFPNFYFLNAIQLIIQLGVSYNLCRNTQPKN